jgi:hypothetical protein
MSMAKTSLASMSIDALLKLREDIGKALNRRREKETALRQKRADCRKQARQQKVPLLKRRAFVKDCMSRS